MSGKNTDHYPAVWLDIALLAGVALAIRLAQFDHNPFVDELNHVLAARNLLEEGTLQINGGAPYGRSWIFTYIVAGMFRVFGESLVVARIPALVMGVGLIPILYLWVRSEAGRVAALAAAALLCFDPEAIYYSQISRFYTFQVFFLLLGAFSVYKLAAPGLSPGRRLGLALIALAALRFSLHFQILSAVGIGGVLLWLTLAQGPGLVRKAAKSRYRWWFAVGALTIVVAGVVVVILGGWVDIFWGMFNRVDPTHESQRENIRYYHWALLTQYATLWTLFPLAFLVAASTYRRPAVFCGVIFALGLSFHSLAAWKSTRYVFSLMPFFFAICGMAFAPALRWSKQRVESLLDRTPLHGFPTFMRVAVIALLVAAIGFAAAGNRGFQKSYRMITVSDIDWGPGKSLRGDPSWGAAAPELRRVAGESEVVISSSDVKSLYFLDRLDFLLNYNIFVSDDCVNEFDVALRVNIPVITTAESLRRVVECHPTGLVVVEDPQWKKTWAVPVPAGEYLEKNIEQVPLNKLWRLKAFRWSRPEGERAVDCEIPGPAPRADDS